MSLLWPQRVGMVVVPVVGLVAFLQVVPVGSEDLANATEPRPRPRRSRIRETCAPELLGLDSKRETAVTFAKHAQTLCNTSSPWAESHTQVREVLGFVVPWLDHGYKAASYIRSKLSSVSPLWFRILPGRDAKASGAYEIAGMEIADAPEQRRWKARIGTAAHLDLLPHFSIEGFQKLEALKAILEAPEELAAEIAVTCEHAKFDGIVFDLRPWVRKSVLRLVGKGGVLRPEQVVLEIPLYGRAFSEKERTGKVILAGELAKILAKQRPAFTWDDDAQEHSANISSGGARVILSLPTLAFVAERLRLAKTLGVGVALRDLGSGFDVAFDLLPSRPDSGDTIEDEDLDAPAPRPQEESAPTKEGGAPAPGPHQQEL